MNILIVDDEFYLVKNIVDNIPWKDLGIQKVFFAYSADQARKVFEKEREIDLLLTDIEMPKENGLSLIRWVLDQGMQPVTMILTGHQRFDYARAAINLHIFSYILKPVDLTELEDQLQRAILESRKQRRYQPDASAENNSAPDRALNPASLSDPVEKIKAYVETNLNNCDLNRQIIADHIHINPDYMSHLFSVREGVSLSSYINDLRICKAKELLVSTRMPLSEISERTGFSNTSYFHRQFKKACGMTPQSYRDMNSK